MTDTLPLTDAPEPLSPADGRALPSRQQRSGQMRERLLATGTRLLAAGGFDAVSIAQIAAEAGCSVGAFYQRFRNKEAYFEFLLDRVIDQVRAQTQEALAPGRVAGLSQAQVIELCVRHQIAVVREHEGLIRAALGYSMHGSDDWQPIGEIGAWLSAHYIGLIMQKRRPRSEAAAEAAPVAHWLADHHGPPHQRRGAHAGAAAPERCRAASRVVSDCLAARPAQGALTSGAHVARKRASPRAGP